MQTNFTYNQEYTLRWNDYHKKIVNSFQSFHDADDFVDVTIACEGITFSAHKVVLSACSPYFRKLLKANPCSHPIIMLQTISHKQFANIISFIYKGVVHVEPESLYEFLDAAKQLQIEGLTDVQYNQYFIEEDSAERTSNPTLTNKNKSKSNRSSNKHSELTSDTGDDQLSKCQNEVNVIDNKDKNHSNENSSEQNIIKIESVEEIIVDEDTSQQTLSILPPEPPDLNLCNNMTTDSLNINKNLTPPSTNLDIIPGTRNLAKKFRDPEFPEGYRCIVCKRDYSSTSNLRAHVLNVHISTRTSKHGLWYECNFCDKKCKTKHYLTNHQLRKHGIRQKDNKC